MGMRGGVGGAQEFTESCLHLDSHVIDFEGNVFVCVCAVGGGDSEGGQGMGSVWKRSG